MILIDSTYDIFPLLGLPENVQNECALYYLLQHSVGVVIIEAIVVFLLSLHLMLQVNAVVSTNIVT